MELECPVLAITAADRDGLGAGHRMRTRDLRGSSALAYEADVVLILSSKENIVSREHLIYDLGAVKVFRRWTVVSVEKNRFGGGSVRGRAAEGLRARPVRPASPGGLGTAHRGAHLHHLTPGCSAVGRAIPDNGAVTPRTVAVLGSTGSIGTQALEVVAAHPGRFRVVALSAGGNTGLLAQQAAVTRAPLVAAARGDAEELRAALAAATGDPGYRPEVVVGDEAATVAAVLRSGRGPQRRHGLDRPAPHPRRPGCRLHPRARQQGVAHRRGTAGAGRGRAGPDRARRLRAQRHRPEPAGRPRRGGPAPRRHREWWSVPRARPGRARRRHPGPGPGPPQLLDGSGHHDELGDARQQGARGDRGAPALRHPLRPDRRRRAPAAADPLDGRVPRRVHHRPARPAADARADRPRTVLAGAARGRRRAVRLDPCPDVGVPPARRRGVPRRAAGAAGGGGRRHLPGRLQRGERGVRRRLPRRASRLHRDRRHRRAGRRRAHGRAPGDATSVEGVLAADAWARREADTLIG